MGKPTRGRFARGNEGKDASPGRRIAEFVSLAIVPGHFAQPFSYGAAILPIARRCLNFHCPLIFT